MMTVSYTHLSYEKELKEYNKDSKLLTDTLNIINAEKKSLIAMIGENPIMKIDAFSSESVRIKIVATDKARYNTCLLYTSCL